MTTGASQETRLNLRKLLWLMMMMRVMMMMMMISILEISGTLWPFLNKANLGHTQSAVDMCQYTDNKT